MVEDTTNMPESLGLVAEQTGFRSLRRYRGRSEFLYQGIELAGSRVLEVGCGRGAFALWAGLHGAETVLGIEPECDGSTSGSAAVFEKLILDLSLNDQVKFRSAFLHDIVEADGPFDVVLMFNVINHLDEDAVSLLHKDSAAVEKYVTILQDLRKMMSPGGVLIIADCGRHNFWPALGMKSPMAPMIEWDKHQDPKVWIDVLSQAGFRKQDLRWSSLHPLGRLSANFLTQYFLMSHFVLRVTAS